MKTKQMINKKNITNFLTKKPIGRAQGFCIKDQSILQTNQLRHFVKQSGPSLIMASLLLGCVLIAPTFGVSVEDLKAPVKDLKDTIFGGWMWVPKIGAAVGGCLLAVYNQSIMPLATGAGVGLGIHFYDLYIKADGALI